MSLVRTHSLAVPFSALALLVPLLFAACGDDDTSLGGVDGTGGTGNGTGTGAGGELFGGGGAGTGGFQGCTGVAEPATNKAGPATVLLFIDNSPSMRDEILWTRDNLNQLSQTVESAGLDLQVVVIACMENGECEGHDNAWGICVPEPLGAVGGCDDPPPYDDTNMPSYLHVDVRIPSVKGFERVIDTYDDWKDMIRPGTPLHIVGISDDTEEWTAAQFHTELLALDPQLDGYYFHSIFSSASKEDACAISDSEACCEFAAPNGEGEHYRDLVAMTDGVAGDLCEQDFDPVFQEFASAVIASASHSCEWEIPPPPEGETLNPALVNVVFDDGQGTSTVIGQVPSAAECPNVTHGWYYDDPSAPTSVILCAQTCEWIQGHEGSEMSIEFGCATQTATPR